MRETISAARGSSTRELKVEEEMASRSFSITLSRRDGEMSAGRVAGIEGNLPWGVGDVHRQRGRYKGCHRGSVACHRIGSGTGLLEEAEGSHGEGGAFGEDTLDEVPNAILGVVILTVLEWLVGDRVADVTTGCTVDEVSAGCVDLEADETIRRGGHEIADRVYASLHGDANTVAETDVEVGEFFEGGLLGLVTPLPDGWITPVLEGGSREVGGGDGENLVGEGDEGDVVPDVFTEEVEYASLGDLSPDASGATEAEVPSTVDGAGGEVGEGVGRDVDGGIEGDMDTETCCFREVDLLLLIP